MLTFEQVKNNPAIKVYIEHADRALLALGYTEHSYQHVMKVSQTAGDILETLGYDKHKAELARIAGYLHDIGNVVNRFDHAHSGAIMAFKLLDDMLAEPEDVAVIVAAIGNHDESTAFPVDPVAAALILADKSDVRRSRVRNNDVATFDIHDRVNYSVVKSELNIIKDQTVIELNMEIDTEVCSVVDYFEIFLERMLLCRRAAERIRLTFQLVINGQKLL